MKSLFVLISLLFASLVAQAGPLEELSAALKVEQAKNADKVQIQGTGQTVLRTYLATTSGFMAVTTGNTYFGYMVSKAEAKSAILGLGFTMLPTQGTLDVFSAPVGNQYFGYTLLVYYDAAGNANEIYMSNTKLP